MALDFDADLDIFLNPDEFGKVATIDPEGTPRNINVIFDTMVLQVDGQNGPDINSAKPWLTGKTTDLAGVAVNTRLAISGVTYRVARVGPDEDGLKRVDLHRL